MAVNLGARLAARAPVPVHAVAGIGARDALLALRARSDVELVASPRHATVLLVAGILTGDLLRVVAHVHDQVPPPRAAVWWGATDVGALGIPAAVGVDADADVVEVLRRVHREVVTGERASTPAVGPDRHPTPWRGVGPHGQGGEGMMGGRPYGRAMAMTGPDIRDGLALDRVAVRLGPALPGLPPGLVVDVQLQGDVIQAADVAAPPRGGGVRHGRAVPSPADPWDAAGRRPVAIAEREMARARHHVLRVAEALWLYGLWPAGTRVARLALNLVPGDARPLRRLRRLVTGPALWGATAGVARIGADAVRQAGLSGVVARAAGVAADAREGVAAYQALGFGVVTGRGGDARARWIQRVDEAAQAVELAGRAGRSTVGPDDEREDVRSDRAVLDHLPRWLVGLEWGDAITLLASLDIDLGVHAAGAPDGQSAA